MYHSNNINFNFRFRVDLYFRIKFNLGDSLRILKHQRMSKKGDI